MACPRRPTELTHYAYLLPIGTQGRQEAWSLIDHHGRATSVCVDARFESNFGELLHDAVVTGLGIAKHSIWHIGDDLKRGRLQVV